MNRRRPEIHCLGGATKILRKKPRTESKASGRMAWKASLHRLNVDNRSPNDVRRGHSCGDTADAITGRQNPREGRSSFNKNSQLERRSMLIDTYSMTMQTETLPPCISRYGVSVSFERRQTERMNMWQARGGKSYPLHTARGYLWIPVDTRARCNRDVGDGPGGTPGCVPWRLARVLQFHFPA